MDIIWNVNVIDGVVGTLIQLLPNYVTSESFMVLDGIAAEAMV